MVAMMSVSTLNTAPQITADALAFFWNAAIGAAHEKNDSTAFAVVCCIAEGVQAVANRLSEAPAPSHEMIEAERGWEVAMMAAIGEDGIGSVTEAILKLKAEKNAAELAQGIQKKRADGLQRDLDLTSAKLKRTRGIVDLMHRANDAMSDYLNGGFFARAIAVREFKKIEAEIDAMPPEAKGEGL